MPIYEYECTSCGKRFEVKQSLSEPPIKTCDQFSCEKAQPVTKVISPPAIMFKGSGWYVTDYSDKYKDGKQTNNEGKSETKSETKSDSSPSKESASGSSSSSTASSPAGSSGTTTSNTSSSSSSG